MKEVSGCHNCPERKKFDFKGCALTCQLFKENLKKVIESKKNPCFHIGCGVPNVTRGNGCKLRKECPILEIYVNPQIGYEKVVSLRII